MIFRFPGADKRVTILGANGSGKSAFGTWLLSHQRFDKRPWIIITYKDEPLVEEIGFPPLQELKLGSLPGKRDLGAFQVSINPGQEDETEEWLWAIWRRENIGIFCDEAQMLPHKSAFRAILRQGRSKRIPVIACSQRPVDLQRELLSEANFFAIFRLTDDADYKRVREFVRADMSIFTDQKNPFPRYHCVWYDVAEQQSCPLQPVPIGATVAQRFRDNVPYRSGLLSFFS